MAQDYGGEFTVFIGKIKQAFQGKLTGWKRYSLLSQPFFSRFPCRQASILAAISFS